MNKYLEKLAEYKEQTALCFENSSYSYQDLNDKIVSYIESFKEIEQGSTVSIVGDYSFESIAIFFSLLEKKCIIVPIVSTNDDEILKRESVVQLDYSINLRNDDFLINCKENKSDTIKHKLVNDITSKGHAGLVLFSSGSTGLPKAMIHDLDNLCETYLDKKSKSLSIMVFLMFDHIGGLNTLLNSLSMGAKIVFPTKREPEHVASLIESEKVNLLPASPTFLNMMLIADVQSKFNLKSLRMITYGTEAMPESLLLRIKNTLPRVKLLQTFGTSETGIIQTSSRSSSSLDIRIDDPNQEYKIVNNELWLRSKTQILGYLNHDMGSFSDDGWFQTGDLVEELQDGYLKIIGRLKEVINVGGEKVLPSEVESVVLEIDDVVDCIAFSSPNAITGQTVAINVVTDLDDVELKLLKKKIRKYCLSKLDVYKVPTKINFTNSTNVSARFKKIRTGLS
ncbi:AMP-binding protein [Aliivibrio fischeri]|uniref:AMP-binding protein n=1 Tax=Aliivibrio fischeri TaxID=668 RepID=UPI0012DABB7B|nr:AMP-binding protein [Aliivibrio fischeri]MCE7566306.1 AMP-binding protein [Aliivibrio fischeri]MUK67967.1 AMP-binding protein [Aliivibrio fischeri]MUK72914.1 AMP-binding protein [Aliivibrio fischeri]